MKKHQSANEAVFNPQAYKTFEGALESFFSQECPQLGGFKTRQVLVNSISNMVNQFFPETSRVKPGQTPWVTVHKDEKASYGKSIGNTRLTTVMLDLIQSQDPKDRANGKKLREIKKEASIRLFKQAYKQQGCLTNAEVSIMLKISPVTVSKYIKEWELENNSVVPRRGSIHDIGPTFTHKKIIIQKLFMEQKSVEQVSRETYHSLEAIHRYISTFKKVLLCKQKQFTTHEIAYAVGKTERLIKEYEEIIENFKERNYIMKRILNFEITMEVKNESL